MADFSLRLWHQVLVRNYVCARCWGRLVEFHDPDGAWRVRCTSAGCGAPGFIRVESCDRIWAAAMQEYADVVAAYPELDARPPLTDEQRRAIKNALW